MSKGHSGLEATYDPVKQEPFTGMKRSSTGAQNIGTEMTRTAIDTVGGIDKVQSLRGELGGDNADMWKTARKAGLGRERALWETAMGKTAWALGFQADPPTLSEKIATFRK